jgi:hypothetical protein
MMEIARKEDGTIEVDGNPTPISEVIIEGHTIKYVLGSDGCNYPVSIPGVFEEIGVDFSSKMQSALGNPELYQGE